MSSLADPVHSENELGRAGLSDERVRAAHETREAIVQSEGKGATAILAAVTPVDETVAIVYATKKVAEGVRTAAAIVRGSRVADDVPIGTGAKFGNQSRLEDHYERHGADFGATDAVDYERRADGFLTGQRNSDTLERVRENGDVVRYNPNTDEFGVVSKDGVLRTYFKPDPSVHGRPSNLDYFNEQ